MLPNRKPRLTPEAFGGGGEASPLPPLCTAAPADFGRLGDPAASFRFAMLLISRTSLGVVGRGGGGEGEGGEREEGISGEIVTNAGLQVLQTPSNSQFK